MNRLLIVCDAILLIRAVMWMWEGSLIGLVIFVCMGFSLTVLIQGELAERARARRKPWPPQ